MGFLEVGEPFDWPDSRDAGVIEYIREHGITQFLSMWEKVKGIDADELKWGDEIEYILVTVDDQRKVTSAGASAEKHANKNSPFRTACRLSSTLHAVRHTPRRYHLLCKPLRMRATAGALAARGARGDPRGGGGAAWRLAHGVRGAHGRERPGPAPRRCRGRKRTGSDAVAI